MRYIALVSLVCAVLVTVPACRVMVREARRGTAVQRHQEPEVNAALARYKQLTLQADAQRLADMFDANAELSHDDQRPYTGHEAILSFFHTMVGFKVLDYELRATSTSVETGSATQSGTYSQTTLSPGGETLKAEGTFKADWMHQPDGRWLLRRMHTTSARSTNG